MRKRRLRIVGRNAVYHCVTRTVNKERIIDRAAKQELRCRVRYFTNGAVLGSEEYVRRIFEEFRSQFGPNRRIGSRKMRGSDWEELMVMHDLCREVFG